MKDKTGESKEINKEWLSFEDERSPYDAGSKDHYG